MGNINLSDVSIATMLLSYLNDFNGGPVDPLVQAPPHKDSVLVKAVSSWVASSTRRKDLKKFLKHPTVA